jgi:hypothetical protein
MTAALRMPARERTLASAPKGDEQLSLDALFAPPREETTATPAARESATRSPAPTATPVAAPAPAAAPEGDGAPAGRVRPPAAGRTLDDVLVSTWEELSGARRATCPVCGGTLMPRRTAGRALAGTCGDCGTSLT